METYYRGENIIITGILTDKDGNAYPYASLTDISAVVEDAAGVETSYTSADFGTHQVAHSYKMEITAAQTAGMAAGQLRCAITLTFIDPEFGGTTKDIKSFVIGKLV